MSKPQTSLALAALLSITAIGPAFAACTVSDDLGLLQEDVARLDGLAEARSRGLAQALRSSSAADRAAVAELLAEPPRKLDPATVPGDYRCRTIKLGGITDLTAYGWFRCAITAEGDALSIVKLTGSQNFTGTLHPAGDGLLMVGAGHYNRDPANGYGDDPERNIVGCLVSAGVAGGLLLEEPYPRFESVHDLIVLEPAR
jgi:hypothetical protein